MTHTNKPKSWRSSFKEAVDLPTFIIVIVGLLILAMALPSAGCATTKKVNIPTYGEAKAKAEKGGPFVQDPIEKREGLPEGKVKAVKKGEVSPFTGNLIDNDKARYYIAIKAERKRLRKELGAARLKAAATKIITDALVERLKQEAIRSWWEKNKGTVALVTGIIIGTAFSVGLTYALTRGKGAATTNFNVVRKPALVRW